MRVTRMCAFGHAVTRQNETKVKEKKKTKSCCMFFK